MMNISVSKNFDLTKLAGKFDFSQELNEGSRVIKTDIQEHIHNQKRIDNESSFVPLKPETIRQKSGVMSRLAKKRKGASAQNLVKAISDPAKALIRTGNLIFNQKIKLATASNQTAEITIGDTRAQIAVYHQEGTETIPARPFFGISVNAQKKVLNLFQLKFNRLLEQTKA